MKSLTIAVVSVVLLTSCTNSSPSSESKSAAATENKEVELSNSSSSTESILGEADNSQDVSEEDRGSSTEQSVEQDTAIMRGRLAKLSTDQVQQLLNADLKSPNLQVERQAVIVPSYIPDGFEVTRFVTSSKDTDDFYFYYDLVYSNQDDACFLIRQYAFDGPTGEGAVEVERIEGLNVPGLDISMDLGYIGFNRVSQPDFIIASLSGSDNHRGANYDFFSPIDSPEYGCSLSIELKESIRIVQSLQYLDPNETRELKVSNNLCILGKCYPGQ